MHVCLFSFFLSLFLSIFDLLFVLLVCFCNAFFTHRFFWPRDTRWDSADFVEFAISSRCSRCIRIARIDCNETFRYLKLPIVRFMRLLLFTVHLNSLLSLIAWALFSLFVSTSSLWLFSFVPLHKWDVQLFFELMF